MLKIFDLAQLAFIQVLLILSSNVPPSDISLTVLLTSDSREHWSAGESAHMQHRYLAMDDCTAGYRCTAESKAIQNHCPEVWAGDF